MKNIIIAVKEIVCAFLLVCIFSGTCFAAEGDALDVFEEFASKSTMLVCENIQLSTNQNTALKGQLKYKADTDVEFMITSVPEKGEVELTGTNGEFTYTPFEGKTGEDRFSFRISTEKEESNIAICVIDIKPYKASSPSSIVYADMQGHWGEYSAVKLMENDIIKGERIGSKYYFYPDKLMSRIDVINIVLSALGAVNMNIDGANTHIFEDSGLLPDYINNSAYCAHKLGIIDGSLTDGKLYLNPYENVTRAELMKMIDRAMSSKTKSGVKLDFTDYHSLPDWAVQSVKNLVGYGITHGYGDNTIRPNEFVTKAQTAEMTYQMIKYNQNSSIPTASARIKNGFYNINII